jgi:RNA 3'-terminal phosphate cyclase-like protein
VDDLRVDDPSPGLRDYEANLLRLLEKVTNGTLVEINETGARRERGHVARRASV